MPMILLVTLSRAARSRVEDGGGGGGEAAQDESSIEAATARSGRWKFDMATPGQDIKSLRSRAGRHKAKTCQCVVRRSSSVKSSPTIPRVASTCGPKSLNVADRP